MQKMNEEQVVRNEARELHESEINRHNAIDDFRIIKKRLNDFYSPQYKSIFLDEIELLVINELQSHRDRAHGGKASPTCHTEINAEKLLFYIKQEIGTLPVIAHQRYQPGDRATRNKVFISYSHFDKEFLSDVKRHFKPFEGKVDYWDDSKISPGQKWREEIEKAIKETKVAILLVSTDFFGSDFIVSDELPPLLEAAEKDGAVILNVIIKPCLFEEFGHLNQFQAMNPPDRPVLKMNVEEREELYVNLVRQTIKILNEAKD